MVNSKSLLDYTDLLSPTEYEKRDKTISPITYTSITDIFNNLKLKFIYG